MLDGAPPRSVETGNQIDPLRGIPLRKESPPGFASYRTPHELTIGLAVKVGYPRINCFSMDSTFTERDTRTGLFLCIRGPCKQSAIQRNNEKRPTTVGSVNSLCIVVNQVAQYERHPNHDNHDRPTR
jgi:hypothetical protein